MLLAVQVEMIQAAGVHGRLKGELVNRCGEFCVVIHAPCGME